MKIEKVDGVYKKPGLHAKSKVPLLVWAPMLLIASAALVLIQLRTQLIIDQNVPQFSRVRKHSYKLAAVGDIACAPSDINFNEGEGVVNACKQQDVGLAVEKENTDAVLLLGDIQYLTGQFEDYERSFIPYWRDIKSPMYVAMGNHDYGNGTVKEGSLTGTKKAFDMYFPAAVYEKEGKTYYKQNFGVWEVYFLDSNCEYVGGCDKGSKQYEWLETQLADSGAKCSAAVWHHPIYTSGVHRGPDDTERAKPFEELLANAGVDIVLNGHDHHYERVEADGYKQFVVGSGGMSLRKTTAPFAEGSQKIVDDSFGYLYLQLFPGRYVWEFKDTVGHVLDTGSESCN